ncbi:MAG: TetR/AcrR family transcriptional regulator [Oscillospiraceae bacterium]|nr:TetR/AcrR family transcriptional regulator [Oscillospiraceae bacterium]
MAEKTNLRDKLLDVGMAELNEFGYHNFSVRRIAAKCGVSCAAPYKHFKDKHSYVAAILEHINQQWTERQEAIIESYQGVWQRQIVEVCLEYIRFLVEVPYFRSAIMLKDESFDEEFQRPRGRLSDASRALIDRCCEEHGVSDDVKKAKVYIIRSLIYGAALMFDNGEFEYSEENMAIVRATIERELASAAEGI